MANGTTIKSSYNIYDPNSAEWKKYSFETLSESVGFSDGQNAETKLGSISGITDSLVSEASDIAASAKSICDLNKNLGGCSFEIKENGAYITYTPPGGADPVSKKLGEPEIKVVSKTTNYPMAGVNSEQTVTFSVEFDAIEGYKLAYAGITQMNTYISNGTIKYVEFTNMQITENTVSWSVHTKRGTGAGTASVVIQGVFIPV